MSHIKGEQWKGDSLLGKYDLNYEASKLIVMFPSSKWSFQGDIDVFSV